MPLVVLCSKTYRFRQEGMGDFVLHPSPRPQSAPDHIEDHVLFQLAVKDGSIIKMNVAEPEKQAEAEVKQEAVEAKPVTIGRRTRQSNQQTQLQ